MIRQQYTIQHLIHISYCDTILILPQHFDLVIAKKLAKFTLQQFSDCSSSTPLSSFKILC